jgi:hypothetical protein
MAIASFLYTVDQSQQPSGQGFDVLKASPPYDRRTTLHGAEIGHRCSGLHDPSCAVPGDLVRVSRVVIGDVGGQFCHRSANLRLRFPLIIPPGLFQFSNACNLYLEAFYLCNKASIILSIPNIFQDFKILPSVDRCRLI